MTKAYSYIRFSSPEQRKGDSLRRQMEASELYCKENGLQLDKSLTLRDLGLSAYSGAHRTKGALGTFLKMVENGKIPKGSYLIIESLDRLSREEVLSALSQFTGIIESGITIVTLADKKTYSREGIKNNWADLIISITIMSRAHEESETKSKRGKSVWEHKRKQALTSGKKLTARCPLWIKYDKKDATFHLLPEPCKAIETIYRMRLSGKGKSTIVKELNQNPHIWKPPVSKRNKTGGWQEPYVDKILSDPVVIGTYQPRKRVANSKKAKAGEAIPNYYPAAISEQLYYEVQSARKKAGKSTNGGQIQKATNLFVHLVKCGHCQTAMHFFDHGKNKYLRCDAARRKIDLDKNGTKCTSKGVQYDEVETIIFENLEELHVSELLPNQDQTIIRLNDIERRIIATNQKLAGIDEGIENISETIFNTKDANVRGILEKRLSKAIQKKSDLKKEAEKLQYEKQNARIEVERLQTNIDSTKKVYELLQNTTEPTKQKELRLALRQELKKLIKRIDVYTLKEPYEAQKKIEPNIYQIMNSKTIQKIRITFNAGMSESVKRVIFLKTFSGAE